MITVPSQNNCGVITRLRRVIAPPNAPANRIVAVKLQRQIWVSVRSVQPRFDATLLLRERVTNSFLSSHAVGVS